MTIKEAIRLLDPATTAEAISEIEYYGGFNGEIAAVQAVSDACEVACEIMRKYLGNDATPVSTRKDRCLWTVSIKDREDEYMNIWTASFSTEEKADEFKAAAEEKLKHYGVYETVDVCKDSSEIDEDMYLNWIDARYGETGECY